MLAHMQLKFRTAELQHEEVLEDLPKAIRSSIAQHLFRGTVENAYLFKGISEDLIVQLVKQFRELSIVIPLFIFVAMCS